MVLLLAVRPRASADAEGAGLRGPAHDNLSSCLRRMIVPKRVSPMVVPASTSELMQRPGKYARSTQRLQ